MSEQQQEEQQEEVPAVVVQAGLASGAGGVPGPDGGDDEGEG